MDADEGGSEGVGGEGGEGGGAIAVAIEKADHSLEKDHLVLFQGFEIKGTFHMYMYMYSAIVSGHRLKTLGLNQFQLDFFFSLTVYIFIL